MQWGEYRIVLATVERAETTGTDVIVRIEDSQTVPPQCRTCGSCLTRGQPSRLRVSVPLSMHPIVGQTVRVRFFAVNPALGAALIFGIPLLLAAAGLTVGVCLSDGQQNSAAQFIGSLVGLLTGGAIVYRVEKLFRAVTGGARILDQCRVSAESPQNSELKNAGG